MALIFGFMKTQDPTSTVREGEFATAENARGMVGPHVRRMYNRGEGRHAPHRPSSERTS